MYNNSQRITTISLHFCNYYSFKIKHKTCKKTEQNMATIQSRLCLRPLCSRRPQFLLRTRLHPGFKPGPSSGGKGGKFSRAPQCLGAPPSLKNTEKGVPDGFFLTSNMHNTHFRPRLCPRPCWGSLQCSPRPLAGW